MCSSDLSTKQNTIPSGFEGRRVSERTVEFKHREGPWEIGHRISFDESGYGGKVSVFWTNTSKGTLPLVSIVNLREKVLPLKQATGFLPGIPTGRSSVLFGTSQETNWYDAEEFCKEDSPQIASGQNHTIDFMGFDHHYFLKVFLPESSRLSYNVQRAAKNPDGSCEFSILTMMDQGSVASGDSVSMDFKTWFGPKQKIGRAHV